MIFPLILYVGGLVGGGGSERQKLARKTVDEKQERKSGKEAWELFWLQICKSNLSGEMQVGPAVFPKRFC